MRLKKCANLLFWAEYLNKLFSVMCGKFKFSAQDIYLAHLFEPHQTFWQKANFSSLIKVLKNLVKLQWCNNSNLPVLETIWPHCAVASIIDVAKDSKKSGVVQLVMKRLANEKMSVFVHAQGSGSINLRS